MPGAAAGINAGFAFVELRLSDTDFISAPLKEQTTTAAEEASKTFKEKLTEGVKSAGQAASKGLDVLGVAAGAALAGGIAEGLDVQAAQSKLKAQLGLTADESERIGKVAGTLFANAYGESMEDVNEAVKSVIQNIDGMRTASSAALQDTTKDALNLATVMDEDVSSVTRAVAQMLKTQMAPNAKEAFDILAAGVQNGANKSEDLLDTFNEYSVQFKKLGLDGTDALGLIQQGLQGGARDADLVADALKEFSLQAISGSDTVVAAYKSLGLSADDMKNKIAAGGPAAKEALGQVLTQLRAVKDPAQQAALATSLFGTQAEDLGQALFKLDPTIAAKKLGDFKGSIDNVDKSLNDNAASTLTTFKRSMQVNITNVIVNEVLPALQGLMAFLTNLGVTGNNVGQLAIAVGGLALAFKGVGLAVGGIQAAVGAYQAVAGAVGLATTAIQLNILALREQALANGVGVVRQIAMNIATTAGTAATWLQVAAMTALDVAMAVLTSPITLIIAGIVALIAIFVLLYKNNETFRNIVNATWEYIQIGLQALWDFMIAAWNAIWGVIQAAWGYIQPILAALWQYISTTLVGAFKTFWDYVQIVWSAVETIIQGAWSIIRGIWDVLQVYINTVLIPVFKLIQFWFEFVWFAVRTAAILAWRIVQGVWALIKLYIDNVLVPVFNLIWSTFKIVWDFVSEYAAKAWAVIKPIWDAVWNFIKNYLIFYFNLLKTGVQDAWKIIGDVISAAWDNIIKPAFDALKDGLTIIVAAFRTTVDNIKTVWKGIEEATKAPIKFVIETVYRDGIKAVWDKVADIVKLPHMPDPPSFARGGIMPGYSPGNDSLFAYVSPGEAIMRPEFVKAVGSKFIHQINGTARSSGSAGVVKQLAGVGDPGGVPQYAGQFGFGGIVGDFINSAKGFFADGFMNVAKKTFNGIIDQATGKIGGTPWGQMAIGVPKMLIDKVLSIFKDHENEVGGNLGSVNAIRKVIGTPYSWGGGGPNGPSKGFDQGANTVGFDCSSLMQYGEYQAYKKTIPRTTGEQRPWLKQIPGPVPGAIGQPNPDHTFMATERGTIVEAPHTGAFVQEVAMRQAPFWGLPPYRAGSADTGSQLMPGLNPPIYNGTGQPEPILNPRQMSIFERSLDHVENSSGGDDNSIHVYPQRADFTIADLEALEARRNALSRSGRPK
jgi:phage-related minor tail protein